MKKKKTRPVYFRYAAEVYLERRVSFTGEWEGAKLSRRLVSLHELVPGHRIALGKSKKEDWVVESLTLLPGNFPEFGDWPVAPLPSVG